MKTLIKLMDIKTLVAGIFPVVLGSLYAFYRVGSFSVVHMLILAGGILLLQSCANMVNDYFDHKRGADGTDKADEKVLASGEATPRQVIRYVVVFLMIDVAIGIYYAVTAHPGILVVGVVGTLIMYYYSAGNRPISHTPFGEFVAGSTMGFGIMTTVIYIQSGIVDLETVIVALPTSIYIGTILLTNNIFDHHEDRKAGRLTLPIHIGIHWAELLWIVSCHSLLTFTAVFAFVGYWPIDSFILALLVFPFRPIFKFRSIPKEKENKDRMMGLIGMIGLRYHVAIVAGILISALTKGGILWIFK